LRITALLYETGKIVNIVNYEQESVKIAKDILIKLKYSTNFIKEVSSFIEDNMLVKEYNSSWTDADVRKFEKQVSENLKNIELFSIASTKQYNSSLFDRIKILEKEKMLAPKEELFDGNELVNILGYPSGKWVGNAKKYIEELQFEEPSISKEKAIKKLKFYIEKSKDILL
jgi:tRNA nucleotidyltransferase/poly(A) polymerase